MVKNSPPSPLGIKRALVEHIKTYLPEKMILLSGPRQAGKTYLSKHQIYSSHIYLNFDDEDDRIMLREKSWPRDARLIIFDELHKMDQWKRWLKGIFDKEGTYPQILVTGSARMDAFKKGGDSMAGRYIGFRLHPLSLKELNMGAKKDLLKQMIKLGPFPEPFLKSREVFSKVWRKNHLDLILKEDLLDLGKVVQLKKIAILVQLLSERVGSNISYKSLAKDLQVSSPTIKHWLQILEDLYVVFRVTPRSRDISKSILKAPKYYFYDTGRVRAGMGAKLENIVASHLLKRNHYLEDTQGEYINLFYIRDKEGREVDFAIEREGHLEYLIEIKTSDAQLFKPLAYFKNKLNPQSCIQLVFDLPRRKNHDGIQIEDLTTFLYQLEA